MDLNKNYIIEGNLDFYKELYIDDDSENYMGNDTPDTSLCLISKLALDSNHITLPCNHSFNFTPLYNEIKSQKLYVTRLEISKLNISQIKCPYCRTIHDKLLPHIVLDNNMNYIIGVNTPKKYCMDFHTCSYTFKSGKRKDTTCNDPAYYSTIGCYCKRHTAYISEHTCDTNSEEPTYCNVIMKSGKRKGTACNCKTTKKSSTMCSRHYNDSLKIPST